MLIHDWIEAAIRDKRFKAALEEMAESSLTKTVGEPTMSTTFTAHLSGGAKSVRVSVTMVPEGEMFADDLNK